MNYLQTAAWNHVIAQAVILQERAEARRNRYTALLHEYFTKNLSMINVKRTARDMASAHHDAETARALAHTLREMSKRSGGACCDQAV